MSVGHSSFVSRKYADRPFLLEIQRRILGSQTTTIWGYKKLTIKQCGGVDEVFDLRGYVCVPIIFLVHSIELGGAYVWKSFVLCIYIIGGRQ